MSWREDYEYKRITIVEAICPDCGCYVQVFGDDQQIEFHEQRYFGRLRLCPGTDKRIPGVKTRKRTKLALTKNDKGRFFNPR